ncbi:MAG: hypothetical protein KDG50_11510 [Chromatiales bacterium]|nr:hypothetical protein [Chromatiales bacterium]
MISRPATILAVALGAAVLVNARGSAAGNPEFVYRADEPADVEMLHPYPPPPGPYGLPLPPRPPSRASLAPLYPPADLNLYDDSGSYGWERPAELPAPPEHARRLTNTEPGFYNQAPESPAAMGFLPFDEPAEGLMLPGPPEDRAQLLR